MKEAASTDIDRPVRGFISLELVTSYMTGCLSCDHQHQCSRPTPLLLLLLLPPSPPSSQVDRGDLFVALSRNIHEARINALSDDQLKGVSAGGWGVLVGGGAFPLPFSSCPHLRPLVGMRLCVAPAPHVVPACECPPQPQPPCCLVYPTLTPSAVCCACAPPPCPLPAPPPLAGCWQPAVLLQGPGLLPRLHPGAAGGGSPEAPRVWTC